MRRRLTIRTKLLIVLAVPVAATAGLLMLTVSALNTASVGGPEYDRIAATRTLAAELWSPSGSLQEAHLVVEQLLVALGQPDFEPGSTEVVALTERLAALDRDFTAGSDHRQRTVAPGPLRALLLDRVHPAGTSYFRVVRVELLPALRTSSENRVLEIVDDRLQPFYEDHLAALSDTRTLADGIVRQVESAVQDDVGNHLAVVAIAAMIAAAATTGVGLVVAGSISRPVRQLTEAAAATANVGLPQLVGKIRDGDPDNQPAPPTRFVAGHTEELVRLADALNAMQNTAIELAVNQARARRNVATNLASLGRRNQGLLARAAAGLKELGERSDNSEDNDHLVRLDRLVTRAKRNADSLLVLAGGEAPRARSAAPVAIEHVLRTSAQRIEAWERLGALALDPIGVHGLAADDVASLLAELIENAANFSPPDRPVRIKGELRPDGYVLTIIDEGIGMSLDALALANRRVSTASEFDQTTSRVFGLLVVGHLGQRHGIQIRLDEAASGRGVAARVKLPPPILQRQPATPVVVGRPRPSSNPIEDELPLDDRRSGRLVGALAGAPLAGPGRSALVDADRASQYVDGNVLILPAAASAGPIGAGHLPDAAKPLAASRLEPPLSSRVTRRVPGSHFPDSSITPVLPLRNVGPGPDQAG